MLTASASELTTPAWTSATIHGGKTRAFHVAAVPLSVAWPVNNDAYLIPFYVSVPTTFVEMFFFSGTTPGTANFDLGIYRDDFTRIVSLGATAAVNTTDAIQPVGGGNIADTTLPRGRYYMAMSAAATSITARAAANSNDFLRALGMKKMATAHPLPATVTPASMGTTAFMPQLGMTTTVDAVL